MLTSFTIKDLTSSDHSTAYGVFEAAVNAPLAGVWAHTLFNECGDCSTRRKTFFFSMIAAHTALATHGIYAAVTADLEPSPPTVVVAPAVDTDRIGVALAGTF